MIGPLLHLELVLAGRRRRAHVFRRVYAGWLMTQFAFLYLSARHLPAIRFVESYLGVFVAQQFLLILLATPAFVAGAVTEEKARGTLQHLMTTPLNGAAIVLAKLLGGMAQVGLMLLAGLPLICYLGPYGDFDLPLILVLLGATLAPLFACAAVSLLVSVWSRRTRNAVVAVYVLGALGFVLAVALKWLIRLLANGTHLQRALSHVEQALPYFNPGYVLAPAWGFTNFPELYRRLWISTLAWGALGATCLVLAMWRLRPAYLRQLENSGKKSRRWWRWWRLSRAAVTDDPVRWKEQHVEGLAPLPFLRDIPTVLGMAAVVVLSLWACGDGALRGNSMRAPSLVVLVGTLIVAVRSSDAISGERDRQTWEALLLTPLDIRQLIASKLWGIIAATLPYLAAYAVPALLCTWAWNPSGLLETFLGLVITLLAMHFVGAAGIWCSARSRSSWLSLLGTLAIGYIGGFTVLFAAGSMLAWLTFVLFCTIFVLCSFWSLDAAQVSSSTIDVYVYTAMGIGLALIFIRLARQFIFDAQRWVAQRERTPFWKSGVNCGYAVEQYMNQWGEAGSTSSRVLGDPAEPILQTNREAFE